MRNLHTGLFILVATLVACTGNQSKLAAVSQPAIDLSLDPIVTLSPQQIREANDVQRRAVLLSMDSMNTLSPEQIREANDARHRDAILRAPPCIVPPVVDTTGWQRATSDSQMHTLLLPAAFRRDSTAKFVHGGVQWRNGMRTFGLGYGFWDVSTPKACRAMFPSGPYIVERYEDENGHTTLWAFPADPDFRGSTAMSGVVETRADMVVLWTIFRYAAGWDYDPSGGVLWFRGNI